MFWRDLPKRKIDGYIRPITENFHTTIQTTSRIAIQKNIFIINRGYFHFRRLIKKVYRFRPIKHTGGLASEHDNKYQLEKLFEEYYAAALLYSMTIVKDKDDAEDIVQRAFISLWRKMGSMDFHTSARAYLYKSIYHASLDFLKHTKVRKHYEDELKNTQAVHAINSEEKELYEKIQYAINGLPDQCQRIFKMSRYDGLKYKQIASTLHISEKTVENQMSKALKILRERLTDYLPMLLLLLNFFYGKR